MSSDKVAYQEAPLNQHQFEIILKDDYECFHYVNRMSNNFDQLSDNEDHGLNKIFLSP